MNLYAFFFTGELESTTSKTSRGKDMEKSSTTVSISSFILLFHY